MISWIFTKFLDKVSSLIHIGDIDDNWFDDEEDCWY